MNAGLILAGGTGERLTGFSKPKQFINICRKPLASYCLQVFEDSADIGMICVVAATEWRSMLGKYVYAAPGRSRQHSIYNGLLALEKYAPERVVIHDAVRPFVTCADISGVIASSIDCDGAMPVLPVTDTVYQSTDGKTITASLNRDILVAGQTPECYSFNKYLAIHEALSDKQLSDIRGSSELAVYGNMRIALSKGSYNNFKITTNADFERFCSIINGEFL